MMKAKKTYKKGKTEKKRGGAMIPHSPNEVMQGGKKNKSTKKNKSSKRGKK
jgi:hypothetical protein